MGGAAEWVASLKQGTGSKAAAAGKGGASSSTPHSSDGGGGVSAGGGQRHRSSLWTPEIAAAMGYGKK
jgi:hypothetical protein